MADAHIVSDRCATFLVSTMYNGSILNINPVANADEIHIASHHRLKPHGTFIPHDNITYNRGIFS
jgi:hypothetical protein